MKLKIKDKNNTSAAALFVIVEAMPGLLGPSYVCGHASPSCMNIDSSTAILLHAGVLKQIAYFTLKETRKLQKRATETGYICAMQL